MNSAVIKTQQTGTLVEKTATNRVFCYPNGTFKYLSALRRWESIAPCQRRKEILKERQSADFYKISSRPLRADL